MPALCRACFHLIDGNIPPSRCNSCGSPRLISHPELTSLTIAHLDCDAFYAAIEKRDDPALANKPVIVGGKGKRGVVSTACYIARTYGVHSAQPMYRARKACPDAVIVRPQMSKYSAVGREIRDMMRDLTPLVEPLSIDEAFVDLSGTERLHKRCAAETMARLAKKIEDDLDITVSIGLSYCKFLAKIASDLDKPRGYSVIGQEEAIEFLAKQPVSLIWGVGKAFGQTLAKDGIKTIGQIQKMEEKKLAKKYGAMGLRLARLSQGQDARNVNPSGGMKSISNEVTFNEDKKKLDDLDKVLWRLCENVSRRAKSSEKAGETVTLKLKTSNFKTKSRSRTLSDPTQLADRIYSTAHELLERECDGTPYRLLGVGLANLCEDTFADQPDLLNKEADRRADAERAMDRLRDKFGKDSIAKGRGFEPPPKSS